MLETRHVSANSRLSVDLGAFCFVQWSTRLDEVEKRKDLTGIASGKGIGAIERGRTANPTVVRSVALWSRIARHVDLEAGSCLRRFTA